MLGETPKKLPQGITWDGHGNHAPRPMVECDAGKFWRQFSSYGTGQATTFMQLLDAPGREKKFTSLHIFWYHDCAYGVMVDYHYDPLPNGVEFHERFKPVFYYIGCDHNYVETRSTARGQHWTKCDKCSKEGYYDSSD